EANASGPVGAWLAHLLVGWLGMVAAWGVPVVLLAAGWNRLRDAPTKPIIVRSVAVSLLLLEVLALIGLAGPNGVARAGSVGLGLAGAVRGALGVRGGATARGALFLVPLLVPREVVFSAFSILWWWLVRGPSQTLWDRMRGKAEEEEVEAAVAPAM